MSLVTRLVAAAAAVFGLLAVAACDQQKIKELEEGLSTEADVRARFGEPERVWPEPDGSHTLEYNRQPAGARNYMITIGADGKMSALRQVLAPHNFEKIQPGMNEEQVRRMLGKPAKVMSYQLKQETDWDWNYVDPPTRNMEFTVTFDFSGRVLRTGSREKLPDGP
ncbi:outer membrane protein assembly factor BamE domain-containing protein [Comamonas composti]|uniref:outer membrane protein assembly factor BamE domain-containing protein n=1 Tax=Comamonas composti TaxID=408558 RepID=UPI00047C14FB|nr:outer membrane protein assembly factor BamE [Comamonas composti]